MFHHMFAQLLHSCSLKSLVGSGGRLTFPVRPDDPAGAEGADLGVVHHPQGQGGGSEQRGQEVLGRLQEGGEGGRGGGGGEKDNKML